MQKCSITAEYLDSVIVIVRHIDITSVINSHVPRCREMTNIFSLLTKSVLKVSRAVKHVYSVVCWDSVNQLRNSPLAQSLPTLPCTPQSPQNDCSFSFTQIPGNSTRIHAHTRHTHRKAHKDVLYATINPTICNHKVSAVRVQGESRREHQLSIFCP